MTVLSPQRESAADVVSFADITAAAQLISGQLLRTPFMRSPKLSAQLDADIWVKYENLQATNAFKERGALVCLSALSPEERQRGVVTMSAGNHGQGLAYHAQRLGIPATVVMPSDTPFVKVSSTQAYGAQIVLSGDSLDEARREACRIAESQNLTFVHPYDDVRIIAGQGTIGLEICQEQEDLDYLLVPVGGGGLIAGVAVAAKTLCRNIEVIGVEPALYPSMRAALSDEYSECGGQTLAEGIAVRKVSDIATALVRRYVDDMVLVSETHIEQAVNLFLIAQKTIAEGAGAAGLAALLAMPERFKGCKVGVILSGGNIDSRVLASIMMRELEREQRIVSFRLRLRDVPGELGRIAGLLGGIGANILEVSHNRLFLDVPAKGASVDITVETQSHDTTSRMFDALGRSGYMPRHIPRLADSVAND